MRLAWTRRADRDRKRIVAYVAERNPAAARRIVAAIDAQLEAVLDFPNLGTQGRVPGTREFVALRLPYIVVYTVKEDIVYVVNVWDGRRDLLRKP
jgi:addiction module RelE/StbE family toxin